MSLLSELPKNKKKQETMLRYMSVRIIASDIMKKGNHKS